MTSHENEQIERPYKDIVDTYRAEESLWCAIDSLEDDAEFGKAWAGQN